MRKTHCLYIYVMTSHLFSYSRLFFVKNFIAKKMKKREKNNKNLNLKFNGWSPCLRLKQHSLAKSVQNASIEIRLQKSHFQWNKIEKKPIVCHLPYPNTCLGLTSQSGSASKTICIRCTNIRHTHKYEINQNASRNALGTEKVPCLKTRVTAKFRTVTKLVARI